MADDPRGLERPVDLRRQQSELVVDRRRVGAAPSASARSGRSAARAAGSRGSRLLPSPCPSGGLDRLRPLGVDAELVRADREAMRCRPRTRPGRRAMLAPRRSSSARRRAGLRPPTVDAVDRRAGGERARRAGRTRTRRRSTSASTPAARGDEREGAAGYDRRSAPADLGTREWSARTLTSSKSYPARCAPCVNSLCGSVGRGRIGDRALVGDLVVEALALAPRDRRRADDNAAEGGEPDHPERARRGAFVEDQRSRRRSAARWCRTRRGRRWRAPGRVGRRAGSGRTRGRGRPR